MLGGKTATCRVTLLSLRFSCLGNSTSYFSDTCWPFYKLNDFLKNSKTYHFVYFTPSLPYFARVIYLFLLNPSYFPCFPLQGFLLYFVFGDKVSLYIPDWPGNYYVGYIAKLAAKMFYSWEYSLTLAFRGDTCSLVILEAFSPAHPTSFNSTCLSRFCRLLNSIRKKNLLFLISIFWFLVASWYFVHEENR